MDWLRDNARSAGLLTGSSDHAHEGRPARQTGPAANLCDLPPLSSRSDEEPPRPCAPRAPPRLSRISLALSQPIRATSVCRGSPGNRGEREVRSQLGMNSSSPTVAFGQVSEPNTFRLTLVCAACPSASWQRLLSSSCEAQHRKGQTFRCSIWATKWSTLRSPYLSISFSIGGI